MCIPKSKKNVSQKQQTVKSTHTSSRSNSAIAITPRLRKLPKAKTPTKVESIKSKPPSVTIPAFNMAESVMEPVKKNSKDKAVDSKRVRKSPEKVIK
uniref:Uncharacterized protein n=1 Tax=Caenorhabditis japonica TaxID=281687 RepID=A0A8R1EL48_CAEJA